MKNQMSVRSLKPQAIIKSHAPFTMIRKNRWNGGYSGQFGWQPMSA